MSIYLHFFSFFIFHSLILTFESFSCAVWSASWLSLTHQLGSRPHTFVLWPGKPLAAPPAHYHGLLPPPPLQLPVTLLSYTWLSRNLPGVIITLLTLLFSPGVGFAYWCWRSWTWNLISWLCFGIRLPLETPEELPLKTLAAKGTVQTPQCTATPYFQTRWSSRKSDEGHFSFSQYTLQKNSHWLLWP